MKKNVLTIDKIIPVSIALPNFHCSNKNSYILNLIFQYSLKHHNSPDDNQFSIDEISGTLRIKKRLDFESKQLYNLTVKATDEGSPPLTSFATVLVEVLDVNENQHPPRFETFFLETAVPENMPIGSLVTSVQAHDLDIGDKVSYTIKGKKKRSSDRWL